MRATICKTIVLGLLLVCLCTSCNDSDLTNATTEQIFTDAIKKIRQRNYADAADNFNRILKAEPNNAQALSGLGNTCLAMKNYEEAISNLQKAMAINPSDEPTLFGLGAAYLETGQHKRAIPILERAVEIDPNHVSAHEALAVALVRESVQYGKMQCNQMARESMNRAIALYDHTGNDYRANELRGVIKQIPN